MVLIRLLSIFIFFYVATACVAIDPQVSDHKSTEVPLERFNGTFESKPIYRSDKAGLRGPGDIAEAIGVYNTSSDYLIVEFEEHSSLTFKLIQDDKIIREKSYSVKEELETKSDGQILFPREHEGGSGDGPGIGYVNNRTTLRIDNEGNLVVIQSGGGGGFIGIFPIAIYAKLMSVYQRVK